MKTKVVVGGNRGRPKGGTKFGGRAAGTANKATQDARKSIAAFVDGNADRLAGWLDEMAVENPEKAFNAFMSVVEYHVPKLARTEHVGDGGGAVKHSIKVMFGAD